MFNVISPNYINTSLIFQLKYVFEGQYFYLNTCLRDGILFFHAFRPDVNRIKKYLNYVWSIYQHIFIISIQIRLWWSIFLFYIYHHFVKL